MRIARYLAPAGDTPKIGLVRGDDLLDIAAALCVTGRQWQLPLVRDLRLFLAAKHVLDIDVLARLAGHVPVLPLGSVTLLAPMEEGSRVFAHVANYVEHGREAKVNLPAEPFFFPKSPASTVGHGQAIQASRWSSKLDHEAELAVVIGRSGRNIAREEVQSHIAGYMVANDVSCRDLQMQEAQPSIRASYGMDWIHGKSLDTSCPLGPWITSADEIADAHALDVECLVNGERQSGANTADMRHRIDAQISALSRGVTLYPGDVILTGAPPGGGLATGRYLQPGDLVECRIEQLGSLINTIAAQPA